VPNPVPLARVAWAWARSANSKPAAAIIWAFMVSLGSILLERKKTASFAGRLIRSLKNTLEGGEDSSRIGPKECGQKEWKVRKEWHSQRGNVIFENEVKKVRGREE
jgi:hypothetical protein